jgi:hypothetical protein
MTEVIFLAIFYDTMIGFFKVLNSCLILKSSKNNSSWWNLWDEVAKLLSEVYSDRYDRSIYSKISKTNLDMPIAVINKYYWTLCFVR